MSILFYGGYYGDTTNYHGAGSNLYNDRDGFGHDRVREISMITDPLYHDN